MKQKNIILKLLISLAVFFQSCATATYLRNEEKELKAEKISIVKNESKVFYSVKITNISHDDLFLTIKNLTPLSPEGMVCEYSEKKKYVHLIYSLYKIPADFSHKTNFGGVFVKLEKGETYTFFGNIETNKCRYQPDEKGYNRYLVENIPEKRTDYSPGFFVLSIDYVHDFKCKESADCEKIYKSKEYEQWSNEAWEKQIKMDGSVFSQFIFEIDRDKNE